jgi:hypothetical protein
MSAKLENVPVLKGWVNLTEAAEILGISRQHSYKRARLASEGKTGGYKTLRQIGTKPMYVVSMKELEKTLQDRADTPKKD